MNTELKTRELDLGWVIVIAFLVLISFIGGLMWGIPHYKIYHARMVGEAELAGAQYSKQVAVQTALAKFDASDYEAKAEVRRAQGIAAANKIIGESLNNNPAYLQYLFIDNLAHTSNQVIYVATEANQPIQEAARLRLPAATGQAR